MIEGSQLVSTAQCMHKTFILNDLRGQTRVDFRAKGQFL